MKRGDRRVGEFSRLQIKTGKLAVLLAGLASIMVAVLATPAFLMAREIALTPSVSVVVSTWDAARIKAIRRKMVENLKGVRESGIELRSGLFLSYVEVKPAAYDFHLSVVTEGGKTRCEVDYDFSRTPDSLESKGTVFLLHGYGMFKECMLPWAMELAKEGYTAVALDLPSHGASSKSIFDFGCGNPAYLSAFLEVYGKAGSGPVYVLGHSYGAMIGLHWSQIDSQVAGVVAIAPFPELTNAVGKYAVGLGIDPEDLSFKLARVFVSALLGSEVKRDEQSEGTARILLAHPSEDFVTTAEEFAEVERRFRGAVSCELDGVGHIASGFPLEVSLSQVVAFLARNSG